MTERIDFSKIDFTKGKVDFGRQPRNVHYKELDWHYLSNTTMHLTYRKQVNLWLERKLNTNNFALEEVLLKDIEHKPDQLKLIQTFFYAQSPPPEWPDEAEVAARVTGAPSTTAFRDLILSSLIRIKRRIDNGNRAIEILKPEPFLYRQLLSRIVTIDEISRLTEKELVSVCANRSVFNELKVKMQDFFPDWKPEVTFLDELTPEVASKIYFRNMANR